MNFKFLIVFFTSFAFAGLAGAGEKQEIKMAVEVVEDGTGGEPVVIELNSEDLDFDIFSMADGEMQSITDENGQNILITRVGDGYTLNVDGREIEMPGFDEAIHIGHETVDHKIVKHEVDGALDSTMIITGKPIDEATQQAIEALLESAGYDDDVQFIDHGGAEGEKRIQIKKVERRVESPQT